MLYQATLRIHALLPINTSYSLGASEGLCGSTRLQIRVHNNSLCPNSSLSRPERLAFRRAVQQAAKPFDVGFYPEGK